MDSPSKSDFNHLGDLKMSDVKKRIGWLFDKKISDVTNWIPISDSGGMRVNDVIKRIGDMKVSGVMKRIEMLPKPPEYDVAISIEKLVSAKSESSKHTEYKLRRVPEWVRAVNSDAYTPQYICIGPYHRGEPGNPLRREELKIDSVQRLLQVEEVREDLGIKQEADIRGCFDVLKQEVANTRRFYAREFDMDDDDWAMMLLLDGCFIIMYLFDYAYFSRSNYTVPVAAQLKIDLVLLENQLPFSVLEIIFNFLFGEGTFWYSNSITLRYLPVFYWVGKKRNFDDLVKVFNTEKVHHLVHLIHLAHCDMIDAAQDLQRWQDSKSWAWAVWIKKFKKAIGFCPIMLMMVLFCFKDEHKLEPDADREEMAAAAVFSALTAAVAAKKAAEKADMAAEVTTAAAKEAAKVTRKLLAAVKKVAHIADMKKKTGEAWKMYDAWKLVVPLVSEAAKRADTAAAEAEAATCTADAELEAATAKAQASAAADAVLHAATVAAPASAKMVATADKTEEEDMSLQAKGFEENIASAMELRNLGIRFVTTKDVAGSQYHVRISGNDEDTLVIPPVEVSWKMAPLLHNLIALEQQAANELDIPDHFSKYAFLMYNLINSHEDIALLQGRGILLNNYGTDEQVVSYFKNLVLWNSWIPWNSPGIQTPKEKVRDFCKKLADFCKKLANFCPWKCSRSAAPEQYTRMAVEKAMNARKQDTRMAVEKALDALKDRTTHRAYRDLAEAKKYCNSPVQVVLLITSILLFFFTVVQTVFSLRR